MTSVSRVERRRRHVIRLAAARDRDADGKHSPSPDERHHARERVALLRGRRRRARVAMADDGAPNAGSCAGRAACWPTHRRARRTLRRWESIPSFEFSVVCAVGISGEAARRVPAAARSLIWPLAGTNPVSPMAHDRYVGAPPATPLHARPPMGKLLVLMVTAFVDMVGFAMVLPLIPFYAASMGATGFVVGLLISSFSVAQLVSAPIVGTHLRSIRPAAGRDFRFANLRRRLCRLRARRHVVDSACSRASFRASAAARSACCRRMLPTRANRKIERRDSAGSRRRRAPAPCRSGLRLDVRAVVGTSRPGLRRGGLLRGELAVRLPISA